MDNGNHRDNYPKDIYIVLYPIIDWLAVQLQELHRRMNRGRLLDLYIFNEFPFTLKVMAISLIEKFKLTIVISYVGNKDPFEHLEICKGWIDLYAYSDWIRCLTFQLTLTDKA